MQCARENTLQHVRDFRQRDNALRCSRFQDGSGALLDAV
jgi:hypothetical protein